MSKTRPFVMLCLSALLLLGVGVASAAEPGDAPREGSTIASPSHGDTLRLPGDLRLSRGLTYDTEISEGFEGAWPAPGWQLIDNTDGQYQWGARECTPLTGEKALWCIGGGADGATASCDSTYPASFDTVAAYGPFSLVGYSEATLYYALTGRSEWDSGGNCAYDYGAVGYSTDGVTYSFWVSCGDATHGTCGNGYHCVDIPLTDALGEPEVWVVLAFHSDSSNHYNGFFIDDLRIEAQASGPTPTPTPTDLPSATPTPTWTRKATSTSIHTATPSPTPTRTGIPSATPTPPLAQMAEMRVAPKHQSLGPGWQTYVEVEVTHTEVITGVEIEMWWDPEIVEAVDMDPATPGIQCGVGSLFLGREYEVIENRIDNVAASLVLRASLTEGGAVPQREPALRLTLRALGAGISPVYLVYSTTSLILADGTRASCRLISGEVWVTGTSETPDPRGRIHGVVFHDLDGDGQRDAGEPGLAGATVLASSATAGDRAVETHADGSYDFGYLTPGSYTILPSGPRGYLMGGGPVEIVLAAGDDVVLAIPLVRGVVLPLIMNSYGTVPTPTPTATSSLAPTETATPTPTATCQWVMLMTEDFDKGFPNGDWTREDLSEIDGGEYLWDDDDYRSHSGDRSAWPAAGGADGLDPATSGYVNDMATWMTVGPFDLSDAVAAEMSLWTWQQTEYEYDWFIYGASPDGEGYAGWRSTGYRTEWTLETYDLGETGANVLGDDSVWLVFGFLSDESNTDVGVFVDDIRLRKCVSAACSSGATTGSPGAVRTGTFERGPTHGRITRE